MEIPLSQAMKTNLQSLQQTQRQFEITNEHLVTGKRVSKPTDDPANFFAAATLNDRAADLESRLDGMGQAIQSVRAADNGITAIRNVLSNMRAMVESALTTDPNDNTTRRSLGKKFNDLLIQLRGFARDSAFGGINLLQDNQQLDVQLGQRVGDSVFTVKGFHIAGATSVSPDGEVSSLSTSGLPQAWGGSNAGTITNFAFAINKVEDPTAILGIKSFGTDAAGTGHEIDWGATTFNVELSTVLNDIQSVEEVLKTRSQLFAFDQATIALREEYTQEFITALEAGADNLTLADLNEESANLLALQTAQQIGVQSLSLVNQQTQSVLRLLG